MTNEIRSPSTNNIHSGIIRIEEEEDGETMHEKKQFHQSQAHPYNQRLLLKIIKVFFYLFSDCLFSRLLSFIFINQAAVMWLGSSVNFILQLLFVPFSWSSQPRSSNIMAFLGSYSMIPSIVAFSAHYFWFLVQIGCHCFTKTLRNKNSTFRNNALLFFIDNEIEFIHLNVKQIYRLFITLSSVAYIIYYMNKDLLNCFIVPSGQVPLALMWGLHLLHLLGLNIFVVLTVKQNWNKVDEEKDGEHIDHQSPYFSYIYIVTVLILFPIIFLLLCIFIHVGFLLFYVVWIFMFHQTWQPPPSQNLLNENRKNVRNIRLNDLNHIYCSNICSIFFNGPLDRYYSRTIVTRSTRVFTYKVFILFLQSIILTSLTFILKKSTVKITSIERTLEICIMLILSLIILILLLPPFIHKLNILRIQINLIQCLLIGVFSMLIIGFVILIKSHSSNKFMLAICISPPLFYSILTLIFYTYHIIRDCYHFIFNNFTFPCRSGLMEWLECHHSISIYINAYYAMFIILSLLGFAGLTLATSMYYFNNQRVNEDSTKKIDLFGNYLLPDMSNQSSVERMEACNWQFTGLNIQDIVLLAALAYQPTQQLEKEIKHFYPSQFQFELDLEHSHYQAYGYGNITYFTLISRSHDILIVSIRGTKLLYEWLIDFDMWNESFIYQILSILFPWSKLFPEYLNSRIIKHLSILERLVNQNLKQSKRFYVQQLVPKLKVIRQKYPKIRSFIILGHSLGGGLAKLAGIALNDTNVLISISGPGITYSHAKMDETKHVSMDTINKRIFNLYNDRDIVSWADKQEGLTQQMMCPKHFNFFQCHYINPFLCHVVKECGNTRLFHVNQKICDL